MTPAPSRRARISEALVGLRSRLSRHDTPHRRPGELGGAAGIDLILIGFSSSARVLRAASRVDGCAGAHRCEAATLKLARVPRKTLPAFV